MAFAASAIRNSNKVKLSWLDLRGTALSAIERLLLEEVLLRHDDRSWALVGTHEPTTNRILRGIPTPQYIRESQEVNKSCIIVMGIGGKPEQLLNIPLVKDEGVLVVKRFSGGGTVVMDHSSLWTTFIGRNVDFPKVGPFPRPIMKWSADTIFGPAFETLTEKAQSNAAPRSRGANTLVMDTKGGSSENSGRVLTRPQQQQQDTASIVHDIPDFALVETDFCLGERKMGGNAQAIVKGGWLHHTSFLWDYDDENMSYLSLPSKQPEYRANRSHDDFLVKMSKYYGGQSPQAFFAHVKEACQDEFTVEQVTLQEAMQVVNDQVGGLQEWFEQKSRTKIVTL